MKGVFGAEALYELPLVMYTPVCTLHNGTADGLTMANETLKRSQPCNFKRSLAAS